MTGKPFELGEHVLLVDRRGRRYMFELEADKRFNSHIGHFQHEDVVGRPEGSWIHTSRGHLLLAVRPTMGDYTRLMPRTATVIYPKDLGAIVVNGDIFPGATVMEAGCGSGALTIALMRAVGPTGFVSSYDLRQDMVERASQNVRASGMNMDNVSIELGDVSEELATVAASDRRIDRLVLDLPEPWELVSQAVEAMTAGGVLVSFLPTVLQIRDLSEALKESGRFSMIETTESMVRSWSVAKRSVRPDHRMVGHTGFITTARLCEPKPATREEEDAYSGPSSGSGQSDSSNTDDSDTEAEPQ